MKKLILLIFFFINLLTFSQEGLTKHMLIGEWVSDDTEYQLIVSSPGNWNNFLFLNYNMSQKSHFKILVVDDEKDILVLLKYNLETEGYFVETANSGKEAIKIAEKKPTFKYVIKVS